MQVKPSASVLQAISTLQPAQAAKAQGPGTAKNVAPRSGPEAAKQVLQPNLKTARPYPRGTFLDILV